jgi:hypothetical protein
MERSSTGGFHQLIDECGQKILNSIAQLEDRKSEENTIIEEYTAFYLNNFKH